MSCWRDSSAGWRRPAVLAGVAAAWSAGLLLAFGLGPGSARALDAAWGTTPGESSSWTDGPSGDERRHIEREIERSIARLRAEGLLPPPTEGSVSLGWPLRAANGLADPGYYQTTNFVDHHPAAGLLLDYSCGQRTTDVHGNHRGTDIRTWPFPWLKMQDNQVEVVAAAAGTIVFKQDGFYDRRCDCSSSSWNAVYVRHADDSVAWYGHLKKNSLTTKGIGSAVAAGEYLGIVGSSGCSYTPHLHFELYNGAGELQDPYAGPCNGLNAGAWWSEQPPYYDPGINKLLTGSDGSSVPACPQNEITHEKTDFAPGETIWLTAFLRDMVPGEVATFRVLGPDGSVYTSWAYESGSFLPTKTVPKVLSAPLPTGAWRYTADFAGQTHELTFNITYAALADAGRNSNLRLGKATGAGIPLTWDGSCRPSVNLYSVYAGFIGDWDSHVKVTCDIAGESHLLPLFYMQSNRYYLVVPTKGGVEGSYGRTSAGQERPQGVNPCHTQSASSCTGPGS